MIVGVRPEYLVEAEDGIEGRVDIVENLGTTSLVTLTTTGPPVQVPCRRAANRNRAQRCA